MATWHPLRQVGTPPADSLVVDSLLDNLDSQLEDSQPEADSQQVEAVGPVLLVVPKSSRMLDSLVEEQLHNPVEGSHRDSQVVAHSRWAAHTPGAGSHATVPLFCPGYGYGLFDLDPLGRVGHGLLGHPVSGHLPVDHQNPGSASGGLDQS